MIMLVADDLDRLTLRPVKARHKIVARLRAGSLDDELAAGIGPETCDYLAARALQLTSATSRRRLAAGLDRVLDEAGALGSGPPAKPAVPLRVPLRHACVARAAAELRVLSRYLLAPGPVPAKGVAMVRQLLCDGAGPLYQESCLADLRDVARCAVEALGE